MNRSAGMALAPMPSSFEGGEMIQRLTSSFETFIEITEELRLSYDRLRERADAMDLELKDANRRLSGKVAELDGMTRRLDSLLQSLPSAVLSVDEQGAVTHLNRAAERMLALDRETVRGKRVETVPGLREVFLLARERGRGKENFGGEERTVLLPDGRRFVLASRVAKLRDAAGRPDGWIEIVADLTETDRLRREVHRLDTLAAMGEMAAGVAHQIRNPLNGAAGFASLLVRALERDASSNPERLRHARNIVTGVREVNAIITAMLMLARTDRLRLKHLDLNLLAGEIANDLREAIAESGWARGVEVLFRPHDRPLWIRGDGLQLKQALLNLGRNALDAFEDERVRRIRISTRLRGGEAEIRVTDTGAGMSAETAARAFQPFFTSRDHGTGLGLPVASKIIDLHGGKITLRSLPGTGTAFRVRLNDCAMNDDNGDTHA